MDRREQVVLGVVVFALAVTAFGLGYRLGHDQTAWRVTQAQTVAFEATAEARAAVQMAMDVMLERDAIRDDYERLMEEVRDD